MFKPKVTRTFIPVVALTSRREWDGEEVSRRTRLNVMRTMLLIKPLSLTIPVWEDFISNGGCFTMKPTTPMITRYLWCFVLIDRPLAAKLSTLLLIKCYGEEGFWCFPESKALQAGQDNECVKLWLNKQSVLFWTIQKRDITASLYIFPIRSDFI